MKTRPSGVTIIELMLVVTIIGLLSTVAIPSFAKMKVRSKQAERSIVMRTIDGAVEEYYAREGRYPGGTEADSTLSCPWNPAFPPNGTRRVWDRSPALGDWSRLSMRIDGGLYYSYDADATATAAGRERYVYAYGDLDGDLQYNLAYRHVYELGTNVTVESYDSNLVDGTL